jgi:hypothetical protein
MYIITFEWHWWEGIKQNFGAVTIKRHANTNYYNDMIQLKNDDIQIQEMKQ